MRRGSKEGETGTVAKEEAAEKVTVCVQGGSCEQKKRLRLMADAEEKGWRVMGEGSYERVHRKSDICIIFISPLLSSYLLMRKLRQGKAEPLIYIHTYEHGFHKQGQAQKASWQDNT